MEIGALVHTKKSRIPGLERKQLFEEFLFLDEQLNVADIGIRL